MLDIIFWYILGIAPVFWAYRNEYNVDLRSFLLIIVCGLFGPLFSIPFLIFFYYDRIDWRKTVLKKKD